MKRVIVFDVNETLLDLRSLDPYFTAVFGSATARQEWFTQMIQLALVSTVTNAYTDFGTLGGAALHMLAVRYGTTLTDVLRRDLPERMKMLAPHPEVHASLERLRSAGFRLAALTNSTRSVALAQVTHAGLHDLFEQVLSADSVRHLKPAPQPYHMAAERLGVGIRQIRLVAAHDWDIAGALRAGCAAAFVARPGKVLNPLAPQPDIVGPTMSEVVERIIAVDEEE